MIHWYKMNCMQANPEKFQSIIFDKERQPRTLQLNHNVTIQSVSNVKLLGVNIDVELNFNHHIALLCNKAGRQINALSRLSNVLNVDTKMLILQSFILSHFMYCCIIWHFCSISDTKKIEKMQLKALRHIYKDYTSSYEMLGEKCNRPMLYISSLLVKVKNLKHSAYLCGEYNIDLLKVKINRHYCSYFDDVVSNGFFPKITLPTRLSDHSSTLIDNIFTNNIDEAGTSGILLNSISDHQMIFTYVENVSYITEVPKFIEVERSDERSMHNFVKELDEICIYEQLQPALDANPQENYDIFIKLVSSAKNKHLPKKIVRFNKKKHKKAKWLTNGILKSINTKDKMYKILVKADNVDEAAYTNLKAEFNAYKKTLRRSINEAKRLYYMRTFELYRNDIKQTWSVIKNTLQKNARCPDSTEFVLNNRMITNLDEIANEFNKYFVNIGQSLNDQIQAVTTSNDYLLQHNKTETTFNFFL